MSKIVLNDVTNLNALSVINDNFDKLEQELQNKVMYRNNPEGEPNALQNDVDANGNSIYNVQDLTINGGFTVNGQDVGAYIGQAADAAADAQASATAAATASTSASNSAASAATSASSALDSKNTATTKASEASTSASNAASSASAAASSASTATTQAGIATTAATTATTQAGIATTGANTATTQAATATTQATAAAASAVDAAASAAAAAAAYDSFDDRYLGSKASAPTLDNDGNALITGALYYNNGTVVSADKGMWIYDGGTWIKATSASQAILVTYQYVATAGQTTFSGADVNSLVLSYTAGSIFPTLNGQRLRPGVDYTATNGSTFVLTVAAAAGDELLIDSFSTFSITAMYTKAESDALLANKLSTTAGAVGATNLATNAVTTTKIADANVTVAKLSATGTPSSSNYLRGDGTWSAPTGGVTSITAGNGLTGGTITGSGTIALDFYTGTVVNNTSYPIGSYLITNGYNTGDQIPKAVNSSFTIYSPASNAGTIPSTQFNTTVSSGGNSAALAGTWRSRGMTNVPNGCNVYSTFLMQRTA
jgi:hypothetical protein